MRLERQTSRTVICIGSNTIDVVITANKGRQEASLYGVISRLCGSLEIYNNSRPDGDVQLHISIILQIIFRGI